MRIAFVVSFILLSINLSAQNGESSTVKKTFNRTTSISQIIKADVSVVWSILCDAENFNEWNSTVISIEGKIKEGEKILLKSTLDTSRTFKLKVKEVVSETKLVWGDALGQRTYLLKKVGNSTQVTMIEKIGGPMFPLFAKKIPSFDESFEQFIKDLKREAEKRT